MCIQRRLQLSMIQHSCVSDFPVALFNVFSYMVGFTDDMITDVCSKKMHSSDQLGIFCFNIEAVAWFSSRFFQFKDVWNRQVFQPLCVHVLIFLAASRIERSLRYGFGHRRTHTHTHVESQKNKQAVPFGHHCNVYCREAASIQKHKKPFIICLSIAATDTAPLPFQLNEAEAEATASYASPFVSAVTFVVRRQFPSKNF